MGKGGKEEAYIPAWPWEQVHNESRAKKKGILETANLKFTSGNRATEVLLHVVENISIALFIKGTRIILVEKLE